MLVVRDKGIGAFNTWRNIAGGKVANVHRHWVEQGIGNHVLDVLNIRFLAEKDYSLSVIFGASEACPSEKEYQY